jgi:phosphatidylinositol alpha-1,6-mannosyltransferase
MKVCIICFDFKTANLKKQPWRYVYEIARGLACSGISTVVITDTDTGIDSVRTRTVNTLVTLLGESNEVLEAIREEDPDVVVTLLGPTSFLRARCRIEKPVIGLLTSPLYSAGEVLRVGFKELQRHGGYIGIHLIGSLVPRTLVRSWLKCFRSVVVLSEENKRRLSAIRPETDVIVVPTGIDEFSLERPDAGDVEALRSLLNPENVPIVLYFTSPLTLRGTDTLMASFAAVRRTTPCKLLLLSRMDNPELEGDVRLLHRIAEEEGVLDSVEFISRKLSPDEVKMYLSVADVVCLPFKLVISDTPISILEAMAMEKPVISTGISDIPELLAGRGLVVRPNDVKDLVSALRSLLEDGAAARHMGCLGRRFMEAYPRWSQSTAMVQDLAARSDGGHRS